MGLDIRYFLNLLYDMRAPCSEERVQQATMVIEPPSNTPHPTGEK